MPNVLGSEKEAQKADLSFSPPLDRDSKPGMWDVPEDVVFFFSFELCPPNLSGLVQDPLQKPPPFSSNPAR